MHNFRPRRFPPGVCCWEGKLSFSLRIPYIRQGRVNDPPLQKYYRKRSLWLSALLTKTDNHNENLSSIYKKAAA